VIRIIGFVVYLFVKNMQKTSRQDPSWILLENSRKGFSEVGEAFRSEKHEKSCKMLISSEL
jgi:hypothetical protein